MARGVEDVAKLLGVRARAAARRSPSAPAARASTARRQTEGILVDVRRHWRGVEVEDGGARARVRPGHRARARQPGPRALRSKARPRSGEHRHRHRRRRGRQQLRGHALRRRPGLLLDGVRAHVRAAVGHGRSTPARRTPRSAFAAAEPELARGLEEIRDEIRADAELTERIRRKFEIKNTTGYRLCAFLDADEPLEIFRRLLVGSEGTLAFIAEAVFETVPVPPARRCRGSHFPERRTAAAPGTGSGRGRRERGRADGRAGAHRRRALDPGHAPSTGRSCRPSRRRCWSSSAPTTMPDSTGRGARGGGARRPRA